MSNPIVSSSSSNQTVATSPSPRQVRAQLIRVIDGEEYRDTVTPIKGTKATLDYSTPFGGWAIPCSTEPSQTKLRVEIDNPFGWQASSEREHEKLDSFHSLTTYKVTNQTSNKDFKLTFSQYLRIINDPDGSHWNSLDIAKVLDMV